jgi:hypothetical protein
MPLLILLASTAGCGTSPESKTEAEKSARIVAINNLAPDEQAAAEKKAAEDKAAAEKRAAEDKAAAEKRAAEDKAAAEKRAAEDKAAAEKKAAEDKAAANSYIKVNYELELRGVLSFTEKAVTITTTNRNGNRTGPAYFETKWVLDFGADKEMHAKAKGLDGKTVLANGSTMLAQEILWVATGYRHYFPPGRNELPALTGEYLLTSSIGPEPKFRVKSLEAATKE